MATVKAGFGVLMVGVAIWMLERVLPGSIARALGAARVLTGVFLGAFERCPSPRASRHSLEVSACSRASTAHCS
jgi:thiol:disulfide interchange protein DsbD